MEACLIYLKVAISVPEASECDMGGSVSTSPCHLHAHWFSLFFRFLSYGRRDIVAIYSYKGGARNRSYGSSIETSEFCSSCVRP